MFIGGNIWTTTEVYLLLKPQLSISMLYWISKEKAVDNP